MIKIFDMMDIFLISVVGILITAIPFSYAAGILDRKI